MSRNLRRLLMLGVAGVLMMPGVYSAAAQEDQAAKDQEDVRKLNTVMVTARKREESLQEIPESLAVLPAAELEQKDINNIDDIGLRITNLNLGTRADGNPNVTIRGVGSFGNTQGVGFYIDGVQIFTDASAEFGEIERLEVLKGPQGTLYGGSNIGGAIKFVTKRPELGVYSGNAKIKVGEQNMVNVSGTVNLPVGSIGAVRLFGFHNEDDGFVFDDDPTRLNGRSNLDDSGIWPLPLVGPGTQFVPDSGNSAEAWMRYPNQKEEWGLRGSALFEFTPDFNLYITTRYNELDGGNNNWRADDPRNLTYSPERDLTFAGRNVRETFGASAEFTYTMPWVETSYLASYTDADSLRTTDLDVSSEVGFDLVRPEKTEVNTHELRFTSQDSGPFEWIVGLYYAKIKNDWATYANFYDTTDVLSAVIPPSNTLNILDGTLGDPVFPPTFTQETTVRVPFPFENRYRERENKAVFFTTSYRLDNWELGFGLRVDDWKADTRDRNAVLYATGVPYLEQGGTEVLPKASVSYFMDDGTHVYGNYARGFEPGNFNLYNAQGTPVLNPYKKEIADNFELGVKTSFLDGDVSLNAAAFYIDYTDRQFELQQQIAIGGVIENILNAGDSTQYGLEADVNWLVSDELTLKAGFGLVEAEFGDGSLVNDVNSQPSDVSGKTPPWISDYSFNIAADFETPINNNLDFRTSFEVLGKGPYFFNQENTAQHPSYEVANFFVGIAADRWDLSLNVENLFDTGYYTDGSIWPGDAIPGAQRDLVIGTLGQPRIVSVSAKVHF